MEVHKEAYRKFETFLDSFFIRREEGKFIADDFNKDKFEYIRPHLEKLLPELSLKEALRIQSYFNIVFKYYLNEQLNIPNDPPRRSITPEPIDRNTEAEPLPQPERLQNELQTVNVSELSSQPFPQEQTPLEPVQPGQSRNTVPLMQSTPLSVPREPVLLTEQQLMPNNEKDYFISDILSQINISPIPQASAHLPPQSVREPRLPNVQQTEVSFLRKFGNIGPRMLPQQTSVQETPRKTRKRRTPAEPVLRVPKKKMDRMSFDVLCCLPYRKKTEEQIKQSKESLLYFPLMPGKTKNIIRRIINNVVIPEGQPGHISIERVINLSNVLRAHASQRQISVEQPVHLSQIDSSRSPCTPQALLRASQHLPFTPLRGDISGMETAARSLLRQQPLLPIPERESSIHIPVDPLVEEIQLNNSPINIPLPTESSSQIQSNEDLAAFSNIPRAVSENILTVEEQMEVIHNEPVSIPSQQNQEPLNSTMEMIQPFPEHGPTIPLGTIEENPLNIPRMDYEDFELIASLQVDSLIQQQGTAAELENPSNIPMETGVDIVPRSEVPSLLAPLLEELPLLTQRHVANQNEEVATLVLQELIAQSIGQEDDHRVNWFEILRPRSDLPEYPQEGATRRRKRRRRRRNSEERVVRPRLNYELTDIPRSPLRRNEMLSPPVGTLNQIPDQMPPDIQESINFAELNIPLQNNGSPEVLTNPPARSSIGLDGFSDQVTQHPMKGDSATVLETYLELIKRAGRKADYKNWQHYDSRLFSENDDFEMYTYVFKRIIKDNNVQMDNLYEKGTTRLEAAKGFRLILELKTLGLLEIESMGTRILSFGLKSADDREML